MRSVSKRRSDSSESRGEGAILIKDCSWAIGISGIPRIWWLVLRSSDKSKHIYHMVISKRTEWPRENITWPLGKDKCWRHFHTGETVIQYVWRPENIAAESCIIRIKYAQEQYLVSQSHDIEYTIAAPKLIELITNSYKKHPGYNKRLVLTGKC